MYFADFRISRFPCLGITWLHLQPNLFGRFLIGFALICGTSATQAIELGQIDDFEDGTEQGWIWGRSGFGGPIAFSDESVSTYLETESFGGDDAPGSRMALLNRDQWTGDYVTAGVSVIRLDALNDGPNFAFSDMTVRLAFFSETSSVGSGRVVTSEGFAIARDSGWQELEFNLDNLTPVEGSEVTEVMRSVSEMRIVSAVEPRFIGDQILARLGVDNITAGTAAVVPEPKMGIVWCVGFLLVLQRQANRRMRKTDSKKAGTRQ